MIGIRSLRRRSRLVQSEHAVYRNSRGRPFQMGVEHRDDSGPIINVSVRLGDHGYDDDRVLSGGNNNRNRRANRMADRNHQEISAIKCFSTAGMRASTAAVLLVVLCLILAGITVVHEAHVATVGIQANQTKERMQEVQNNLAVLEKNYAAATEDAKKIKTASEQGFISAKGVKPIMLEAPQNAVYRIGDVAPMLPRDTLAIIMGE